MSGALTSDCLQKVFDEFKNEAGCLPFDKISEACISAHPSFNVDRIQEKFVETASEDGFDFHSFQMLYVELCRQDYFFNRPHGTDLERVFEECFWLTPEELRDILEAFDATSNLADGTADKAQIPAILAACNMSKCEWSIESEKPVTVSEFVSVVAAHKLDQYFTKQDAEVVSKYFPTDTTKCSLDDLSHICEDLGMLPFGSEELETLQQAENAGQFDHADTWLLFARRRLLEEKQLPKSQSPPELTSAALNDVGVVNAKEVKVRDEENAEAREQDVRGRVVATVDRVTSKMSAQSVAALHNVMDFSDAEISALAEFIDGVPAADVAKINSDFIPDISPATAARIPMTNGVISFERVVLLWLFKHIEQAQGADATAGYAEARNLEDAASSVAGTVTSGFPDKPTKSTSSTSDPRCSQGHISSVTSPHRASLPLHSPAVAQDTLSTLADELRRVLFHSGETDRKPDEHNAKSVTHTPCAQESEVGVLVNSLVPCNLVFILGINAIGAEVEDHVVQELFFLYLANRTPANFVATLTQVGIDEGVAREYAHTTIDTLDDFATVLTDIAEVSCTLEQYEQHAFWMGFHDFDAIYDAVTNNRVEKFLLCRSINADNLPAWHHILRQRLELLSDTLARVASKTLLEALPASSRTRLSREFAQRGNAVASIESLADVVAAARFVLSKAEMDLISAFLLARGTHLTLEDVYHLLGRQKLRAKFIYENAREADSDAQQVFNERASGGVVTLDELIKSFAALGIPLCPTETLHIEQSATHAESDLVDFDAFVNLLREKACGYCPPAEDALTPNDLTEAGEREASLLLRRQTRQQPSSAAGASGHMESTSTSSFALCDAAQRRTAAAVAPPTMVKQDRLTDAKRLPRTSYRTTIAAVLIGCALSAISLLVLRNLHRRNSVHSLDEL